MTQTNAQNAQVQNAPTHSRAMTQEQQRQAKDVRQFQIELNREDARRSLYIPNPARLRMDIELLLPWEDSAAGEKTNAE